MKFKESHSESRKKKNTNPTNFQQLATIVNTYLKEEGIQLNFSGYSKTLQRYFRVQDYDLVEIYHIMNDCNLWTNYLSEVANLIQYKFLEYKVETDRLCAFVQKKAIDYDLEQTIKANKDKTKAFEIFYQQLIAQKTFFEKAFWHCYQLYQQGIQSIQFRQI